MKKKTKGKRTVKKIFVWAQNGNTFKNRAIFFHFFAKKFKNFIDGKIHKKYWNFSAKVHQSLPG